MADWRKCLTIDEKICHSQLRVKGTRVLVTNVFDSLAEGARSEPLAVDRVMNFKVDESMLVEVAVELTEAGIMSRLCTIRA